MTAFMQAHGVWEAIDRKDPKAAVEDKMDNGALALIYQGIPEDLLSFLYEVEQPGDEYPCIGRDGGGNVRSQEAVKSCTCKNLCKFTSAIEQFGDLEAMSVEEIVGSLKVHEERLKGQDDSNLNQQLLLIEEEWAKREGNEKKLLLTRDEWPKRTNKNGGNENHSRESRGVRDRSRVRYFNCLNLGHYAAEC
ncbi:uncharacterized protein LOC141666251 [Apium graveolens]|uniref:uncharacterized protein LOC141666251 n=1 Tax=Apium graveolens TaxID=4045 RepID=UPI003D79B30F